MSPKGVRLIEFPKILTPPLGNLTFIEGGDEPGGPLGHIPFAIKRVFYLYDVPGGGKRGGHAHKELEQLIIAISGSFTLTLDNGHDKQRFFLNRAHHGVYVPPMIWVDLEDFATGTLCLVLTSDHYDETDYLRRYDEFLAAARGGS